MSAGSTEEQREHLLERVKRILKVENDDTDELHNKYRETAKDREAKVKLFEKQLNIQVVYNMLIPLIETRLCWIKKKFSI